MVSILVHIANSEPVKLDVEDLPSTTDVWIVGKNPRERNDKEFGWVDEGVTTIMIPMWRINYIQILPGREEEVDIELFYRE